MPQPLSKVKRKATFEFGNRTLKKYPQLALHIAEVISVGSMIEHQWSIVLSHLLQADLEAGVAMYQALAGAEAKRAALGAAATVRLSKDDQLLFTAVSQAVAHPRRLRNSFAHDIWGVSPDIPDALLQIEPAALTDANVRAIVNNRSGTAHTDDIFDKSRAFVWREKDFEDANEAMLEGLVIMAFFTEFLRAHPSEVSRARKKLLHLSSVSRVVQTLTQKRRPPVQP